jgi:hypothetical protein
MFSIRFEKSTELAFRLVRTLIEKKQSFLIKTVQDFVYDVTFFVCEVVFGLIGKTRLAERCRCDNYDVRCCVFIDLRVFRFAGCTSGRRRHRQTKNRRAASCQPAKATSSPVPTRLSRSRSSRWKRQARSWTLPLS